MIAADHKGGRIDAAENGMLDHVEDGRESPTMSWASFSSAGRSGFPADPGADNLTQVLKIWWDRQH